MIETFMSSISTLTGDTRKIFFSNIKTVDESNSARVLLGCKPIISTRLELRLGKVCKFVLQIYILSSPFTITSKAKLTRILKHKQFKYLFASLTRRPYNCIKIRA